MIRVIVTVALAAGLLAPSTALAVECWKSIKQTEGNLVHVLDLLQTVKDEKKSRIQNFIDDAKKMLSQARKSCEAAASPLDKTVAAGKAMVAQGNLAAAQLLIKAN